MAKVNFGAITMPFKEPLFDSEGNPKFNKDGSPVFAIVHRKVRHNKAYFPKRKK